MDRALTSWKLSFQVTLIAYSEPALRAFEQFRQAFADRLEPDCELWSFRGRWKTEYRDWQMNGYVVRRGEANGPYFLTAQWSMDEFSDSE
jgi:hypothetical protein